MNTEKLIETIRAAVADGASDEARAAGAGACLVLRDALQLRHGAAFLEANTPPAPPIAAIARSLRTMPVDDVLALAIAKLRTLLPPDAATAAPFRLNIPSIKVRAP